jgi:hypothetical protein
MVRQEIWALLLTHYAIRALIYQATDAEHLDPLRMSFIRTLRIVRRHVTGHAGFSPERIATCTRHAIAEILQRPTRPDATAATRASPNEPVAPNSAKNPRPQQQDHPKSDSAASKVVVSGGPVVKRRGQEVCSGIDVVLGLVDEPRLRRVDHPTGGLRLHIACDRHQSRRATLERAVRLDRAVTVSGEPLGFACGRVVRGICVGAWCCGQCDDGSHGGNAASTYSRNRAYNC